MKNGISYIISQTGLWLEFWSVVAILGFALLVVFFVVKRRNMVKKEEELEDLLADKYEREAAKQDGLAEEANNSSGTSEVNNSSDSYREYK